MNGKYRAMQTAMNSLTGLLDNETATLRKGDFGEALAGHGAKMSAAVAFQDTLSNLRSDIRSLAAMPEGTRDDILARHSALIRSIENNMRAIKDMQAASERLSRLIAGTLRQAALEKSPLPGRNQPLSVRFNQSV